MKKTSTEALAAAERFIELNARLIDRLRFAHLFGDASAESVATALRAYADPDGGFGNALEPDLRGAGSQPQPVEVALRVLDEIDAFDDPMVTRACDYLTTITRPDGGVPFVLPSVRETPHAPWWQTDDDPPGSLNPTAAIAGFLHKHRLRHPWLEPATAFCWSRIETVTEADPYTARAILPFLDHVPDRERAEKAFAAVGDVIAAGVELDPRAEGHVHFPYDFAPAPTGLAARLFPPEVMDAHLDALVDAQDDDGGWNVNFPFWTPVNAFEWRGFVTVGRLATLRAYGRLSRRG